MELVRAGPRWPSLYDLAAIGSVPQRPHSDIPEYGPRAWLIRSFFSIYETTETDFRGKLV